MENLVNKIKVLSLAAEELEKKISEEIYLIKYHNAGRKWELSSKKLQG